MTGYTDGSCIPNPGAGAWAWALVLDDELIAEDCGFDPETTNNRMEYLALIKLLETHGDKLKVCYSDSNLLVQTVNVWRHSWKLRGWSKASGEIKNLDLVKRIDDLMGGRDIQIRWVKAHNGNRWNEHVDSLANERVLVQKKWQS